VNFSLTSLQWLIVIAKCVGH
jgi:hypothetical protein